LPIPPGISGFTRANLLAWSSFVGSPERRRNTALVPVTIYEEVGGRAFFEALVDRFYAGVETDPILRPMYPDDLDGARQRLSLFLMQFFGGPDDYDKLRGHPRLRMRHMPFPIDTAAREAWLSHMLAALRASDAPDDAREAMARYFDQTSAFLINHGGLSISGSSSDDRGPGLPIGGGSRRLLGRRSETPADGDPC
jgi:hemoglobin